MVVGSNRWKKMVKLNLIVEGGVYTGNVSAETANNAEALRESFHKFFTRLLNRTDIEITIYMGTGYRNAAKRFIEDSSISGFYVDSDVPPESIDSWYDKLKNEEHPEKTIVIPEEKKKAVFFMIQEMEAWFLKQTPCLEKWAEKEGYKKKDASNIADHSLIRGKNIEKISKPSEKLKIIMRRFFEKNKKSATYGKLKTAPGILDEVNAAELKSNDTELQRFFLFINSK